jgi:hypothetical protein
MGAKTRFICDAGLYSYAQSGFKGKADAFDRDGQCVYLGATGSEEGLTHPHQAVEAGQQGLKDVLAAGRGHASAGSRIACNVSLIFLAIPLCFDFILIA